MKRAINGVNRHSLGHVGMITTVLMLLSFVVSSCGDDGGEDVTELPVQEKQEQQEGKDVVVTDSTAQAGITYAVIKGYAYLNRIPAAMTSAGDSGSLKVGVELSTKDDFSLSSTSQLLARGLEDSVFSVSVDTLSANTTYYYRSFISLGNLNLYGAKASFTTKDFESPTLSGEATDLTFTSAKVSYEIPDLTLSERESIITVIAYSTDAKKLSADKVHLKSNVNREKDVEWEGVGLASPCFWTAQKSRLTSAGVDNLQPDHEYYYCLFTCAGSKFKLSEVKSFKTLGVDPALLATGSADDVTFATATLSGSTTLRSSITKLYPNGVNMSCGITYAPEQDAKDGLYPYTAVVPELKDGAFSVSLTGLRSETTYLYRAYVRIGDAVLMGDAKRFTTGAIKDFLTFDVTDISFRTAKLTGKAKMPASLEDVRYTVYHSFKLGGVNIDTDTAPTVNGENLTATLDGLYWGRDYECWVKVTVRNMSYLSERKTFTTQDPGDYITLSDASEVTSSSATISGGLDPTVYQDNNGSWLHIEYGIEKDNLLFMTTAQVNNDRFQTTITNLRPGTTYYYRAKVLWHHSLGGADWIDSQVKSFTTKP